MTSIQKTNMITVCQIYIVEEQNDKYSKYKYDKCASNMTKVKEQNDEYTKDKYDNCASTMTKWKKKMTNITSVCQIHMTKSGRAK
jgi:hypothetical protein